MARQKKKPAKPKLEPFWPAINEYRGVTIIGYQRTDVPMVHEIARAKPLTVFTLEHDFDTCTVCVGHGITLEDFHAFMHQ